MIHQYSNNTRTFLRRVTQSYLLSYVTQDVMKYTEKDLHDLGVEKEAHCFQMASSLVALKTKYEREFSSNLSLII